MAVTQAAGSKTADPRSTLERSQPAIWDSTLSDLRTQARKSRTL